MIELVDHEAWGVKNNPPRTPVVVDSFTSIGKTLLHRTKLEFEIRFFMNNTDDTKIFNEIIEEQNSGSDLNVDVIIEPSKGSYVP